MPIIFITGHGDVPMTVQAMKAGAVEFLTKPFNDAVLLDAIRGAIERSHTALREESEMQALRSRYASLTPREREVMALVVLGLLNKQVGGDLGISEITVKAHRGQLMRKMEAELSSRAGDDGLETGPAGCPNSLRRSRRSAPLFQRLVRCLGNPSARPSRHLGIDRHHRSIDLQSRRCSNRHRENEAAIMTTAAFDDGLSAFLSVRPRLFGIAYRMLGSAAEAEDIVQDVWVRWQTADRSLVRDAAAFLVTTATRLAINVMQSARSRRETYVGPWLPEPVDTSADPGLGAERGEALELGVLVLLEKLSPTERAAYILREAFDYPYRDIANVLRLEEANARQVVTRARQHVANGRRMPASSTEQRRLLDSFIAAAQHGDVAGLEGLLASDVWFHLGLRGRGMTLARIAAGAVPGQSTRCEPPTAVTEHWLGLSVVI